MKTLHFRQRTGTSGSLHLEVPVEVVNVECQVVVIVDPGRPATSWLPGFWERMSQGWQGEPLQRPEQGVGDLRDSLK